MLNEAVMWLSGRKLGSRVRVLVSNPVSYTFYFFKFIILFYLQCKPTDPSRGFVSISWASYFVILMTHPKSYIETTDRRDFGGKPSKWRWGRVLSWKIPEFCSVGRARSKKTEIVSIFRLPFDYPAHSLQETPMESWDSEGVPFAVTSHLNCAKKWSRDHHENWQFA